MTTTPTKAELEQLDELREAAQALRKYRTCSIGRFSFADVADMLDAQARRLAAETVGRKGEAVPVGMVTRNPAPDASPARETHPSHTFSVVAPPTPSPSGEANLAALRADGWTVAVHNDYRLNGVQHTFWLMTKGDRCVKGEGLNDAEALAQCAALVSQQPAPEGEE